MINLKKSLLKDKAAAKIICDDLRRARHAHIIAKSSALKYSALVEKVTSEKAKNNFANLAVFYSKKACIYLRVIDAYRKALKEVCF